MIRFDFRECYRLYDETVKLMSEYPLAIPGVPEKVGDIRRGMLVACMEGNAVGRVAAVAVDPSSQKASCLILSHLPENEQYQSLPISWVERVQEETIYLNVRFEVILALPDWHMH